MLQVNRRTEDHKPWQPTRHSRVCSEHFIDSEPTLSNPDPTLKMGYSVAYRKPRPPPKVRCSVIDKLNMAKPSDLSTATTSEHQFEEVEEEIVYSPTRILITETQQVSTDHSYVAANHCSNCIEKDKEIANLKAEIAKLKEEKSLNSMKRDKLPEANCSKKFVKNDVRVKLFTGLPNKATLTNLHKMLAKKADRMRYWVGAKRSVMSIKRYHGKSPAKPGKRRTLSSEEEFILVMMKIRMSLSNAFLACLFDVSTTSVSSIFNTWVKFLSAELKSLIFWPPKELIRQNIPTSLKKNYPNLRCTLDCSETFIERPRDLYLQASTWSEYKHHNTLKYLVSIAPNGLISFISSAWGGRTSDRHIVQECGLLDLLDAGDTILADRGFTIQEDLLFRQASLVIPPPGSGKVQMTADEVKKTRKIANSRIHVERAINRLKWFKLLNSTVPVTMVPIFDDILVICGALCNLLPPLVK